MDRNHTETSLLLALTSIASGLLVEDIGSRIESRSFDKHLSGKPKFSRHHEEWGRYLRLTFSIEPVGQRYLRTILLRFKFEVGTAIALLLSSPGLFFMGLTLWWSLLWFSLCVAIALGLLFEARCSHQLLSEVRHEILEGPIVYPHLPANGPPTSGHQSSPS